MFLRQIYFHLSNKDFLIWLAISIKFFSDTYSDISYLIIAVYSLYGFVNIIKSLFIAWLFSISNSTIFNVAEFGTELRYVIIFFCAFSVLFNHAKGNLNLSFSRAEKYILCIMSIVILHSVLFSYYISVSILKILVFTLVFIILIQSWKNINNVNKNYLEKWILLYLAIIIFSSIILNFTNNELSYIVNGYGMQGIINQPQAFGLISAITICWLFVIISNNKMNVNIIYSIVFFSSLYCLYKSEARTGLFSILLSLLLLFIDYLVKFKKISIRRLINTLLFLILLSALFALFQDNIYAFIIKRDNVININDIFISSRGVLISPMLVNIEEKILSGVGFGIPSNYNNETFINKTFLGIPISASVEKGVLPIAILEEVGIIFSSILIMLLIIIFQKIKNQNFSIKFLFAVIIFSNLGEATFFSVGGMGLLLLIFVTWILAEMSKN
jgi:hypothetical protein